MNRCATLLMWSLLAAGTYGCAHAQAKTVMAPPPLDVPLPPPRIIQNADGEVAQPIGVPVGSAGDGDSGNRVTPPPAGRGLPAARTDTPRPDPPRNGTAAAAGEAPKPPEEPRAPVASPLQTTTAQREAEERSAIQALIQRANTDLMRVDARRLNPDALLQYNTAKGFITEGQTALNARDLVLARNLANKAATIASQLLSR